MASGELVRPDEGELGALQQLAKLLHAGELSFYSPVEDRPLDIPGSLRKVLQIGVDDLAEGNAVSVAGVHTELTPRQAAGFLGVSRPFLMRLVKATEIPSHKVGTHHRIPLAGLLAYKEGRDKARRRGLDELARESERLGLE